MKRFIFAFGISIIAHLVLILFFMRYKFQASPYVHEIQVDFVKPRLTDNPVITNMENSKTMNPLDVMLPKISLTQPSQEPMAVLPDTMGVADKYGISILELQLNNPDFLLKEFAAQQNFDSILTAYQPKKYWQPTVEDGIFNLSESRMQPDRAAEYLRKKSIGQSSLAALGPLFNAAAAKKNPEKIPPRLKNIPTRIQLHALKVLWDKNKATQQEIYVGMDSTFVITVRILQEILDEMCEQNLIERKKISPSNEFTFLGPFLNHGIEMSELNRKNVVYEYTPRIQREEVMRFLQAKLYELNEKMPPDSDEPESRETAEIIEKIRQILPTSR